MEDVLNIRNVEEIPLPFREVFSEYVHFNIVQSEVLEDILYSDESLVVAAPTGSGKTAIFELAIIKLLTDNRERQQDFKIIYISPIKSLCQERLIDWNKKFSRFGINCICITGDSEDTDFQGMVCHNLIISTPEKWDSLTRRWRDHDMFVKLVKLFMIDEVHLLNEEDRGSTLEVIVSRMKTVQNAISFSQVNECKIRFIAVSATIGNVEDVAEWIGSPKYFRFPDEIRPVQLKKLVLGFNTNQNSSSAFKFDLSLNYRLQSLLIQYSEGKPALIFCSTRKSVEMTAKHLVQTLNIKLDSFQSQKLRQMLETIPDAKIKEIVGHGIGIHHAGMSVETRHTIENIFRSGDLPILIATSTLAMGVNLPAHLVIIKSTKFYNNGSFQDYSATAIHQMIGRAGRPQFDTSATALILTSNEDKVKIEKMLSSTQPVESNLHRHLTEHLNAEVVLGTITDLDVALQWLASTFLYVRARINPRYYGLPLTYKKEQLDRKLLEIFQIDLNKLVSAGMITMDENININPTMTGRLMARYYVDFETMKMFTQITGTEVFIQILALISKCQEFSEMRLRVNDKKTLNLLNKNAKKQAIRFPLNGKIKTWDMKVNCIIQAVLGNLEITDISIQTESHIILRNGERIIKCLIDYLGMRYQNCFLALLNSIILAKCLKAKLWENSPFVSKQLNGIGSIFATQLANAGKDTFDKILESNPRDIELIIKRKPPFGDYLLEEVKYLPRFSINLEKIDKDLQLRIILENAVDIQYKSTINNSSIMTLLIGNNLNEILLYEKYQISYMIDNPELVKFINIRGTYMEYIEAHFISEDWVGIDCNCDMVLENDKQNHPEIPKLSESDSNSKQTSYIQTFLDMYMRIKKADKSKKCDKKSKIGNEGTKQKYDNKNKDKSIQQNEKWRKMYDQLINDKVKDLASQNETFNYIDSIVNDNCNEPIKSFNNISSDTSNQNSASSLHKPKISISDLYDLPDDCIAQNIDGNNQPSTNEGPNDVTAQTYNDSVLKESATCEKIVFSDNDVEEYEQVLNWSNTSKDNEALSSSIIKTDDNKDHVEVLLKDNQHQSKDVNSTQNNDQTDLNIGLEKSSPSLFENGQEILPKNVPEMEAIEKNTKNIISNIDSLAQNYPALYSLSHKYLTDEIVEETNLVKSLSDKGGKKNLTLRNILNCRGKKRKKLNDVNLAEDLEDQIIAEKKEEQEKYSYLENFKKPTKKKLIHTYDSYPDSTVTNYDFSLSPILDSERKQTYGRADHSDNQKNIKWRSPLVFSPGIKYSPPGSFQESKEYIQDDLYNDRYSDSIETNISISSEKRSKNERSTFTTTSLNTTRFPLSDKDNKRHQEMKKLKDTENIKKFSAQLVEGFKMKDKTKSDQNKTTTTVDYYSQLLSQLQPNNSTQNKKKELLQSQQVENKENVDSSEDVEQDSDILPSKKLRFDFNSSRDTCNFENEAEYPMKDIILARNKTYDPPSSDPRTKSEEYINAKIGKNYPVYPDFDKASNNKYFRPTEYYEYDVESPLNSSFRSTGRHMPTPMHYSNYVDPVHVNVHPCCGQYIKTRREIPGEMVRRNLSRRGCVECELRPTPHAIQHYSNVDLRCGDNYQNEISQRMSPIIKTTYPEEYAEPRQLPTTIKSPNPAMNSSRHMYRDTNLVNEDLNTSFAIPSPTYPASYYNQTVPDTVSYNQIPNPVYYPRSRYSVPYEHLPETREYQPYQDGVDKDYALNNFWRSISRE